MIIGVIPDLVSFGDDPPNEIGIALRVHADEEKRGLDLRRFEDVENLRRPFRVGAVVERERDFVRLSAALMIERGKLRKLL